MQGSRDERVESRPRLPGIWRHSTVESFQACESRSTILLRSRTVGRSASQMEHLEKTQPFDKTARTRVT